MQLGIYNLPNKPDYDSLLEQEENLLLKKKAILNGTYKPSAGYGEIAKKHIQNLPNVGKETVGSALQMLGESPLTSRSTAGMALNTYDRISGNPPIGKALRKEAQSVLAKNQPFIRPEDKGKQFASDVTRGVVEMTPALAASFATGSPLPMLAQAGVRGVGQSYTEQRDAGRTPTQATMAAVPSGIAEVAFETPVAKIFLSKGKPFLKKLIASVVGEGVSEGATAAVQEGIRKGTIRPDMTLKEYLGSIGYNAAVGMGAGGVIGGGLGAVEAVRNRKAKAIDSEFAEPSEKATQSFEPELLKLPAPDYSQTPIIAGKDGARYEAWEDINNRQVEKQRRIDMGYEDSPRLSEDAILKIKAARAKQLESQPKEAKQLALPAPDYSKSTIIVGKDGAKFQTWEDEQALEKERQRRIDLGYSSILSEDAKRRIKEARAKKAREGKPLALPDYSKKLDPEGRIIAGLGVNRFETVAERQAVEAEKQRRIDLGIQDAPRLSEKALQKIKAVRIKRQEALAVEQQKMKEKEVKEAVRQQQLQMFEAEKLEKRGAAEEVKNQNAQKKDTLLNFIASVGGINPDSKTSKGDARAVIDKGNIYKFGVGNVLSKKGKSLDEIRELAVEAGFLQEKGGDGVAQSTTNDLLDAIEQEVNGKPVRRIGTLIEPTTKDYLADLEKTAYQANIDTTGKTPQQITTELEALNINNASVTTSNVSEVPQDVLEGLNEEYGLEEDPMLELERMEVPEQAEDDFSIPFYSGFDPSLLSGLIGTKEERAEFYAGLKKVPKGMKYLASNVGGFTGKAFLSIDDSLRIRAKIHKMPTLTKIADMLYGGTEDSFSEAVRRRQTVNHNEVERNLKPIRKDAAMLKRTIHLLQNPKEIVLRRSHEDNAAANIAAVLKEERQYMIDAGLDVGQVEGYFPRVYDLVKILRNEDAFLKAAKEAYKDTYKKTTDSGKPEDAAITDKEAEVLARAWLANIKLNNSGVSTIDSLGRRAGTPKPKMLKERVLSKKADVILKEFLVQDPQEVLVQHFIGTAKKAEFERRFGQKKWAELKAKMIAEADARPDVESQMAARNAIKETEADILAATGNNLGTLSQGSKNILAWLKMFGAMSMLPYATISSLPEVVSPALRAKDVRESFAAFAYAYRRLTKNKSIENQRFIAQEIIGVTASALSDMAAEQRMGGELGTDVTRKLIAKYFTATGLHGFTEGMRTVSTGVGMRYINNLAKGMSKRPKYTEVYLRDLGIEPKDAKAFSEWVLNNGKITAKELQSKDPYVQMYKRALTRFVDQSVIKPDAAEKPRYASHEIGSLFYYLQSFLYGFQKNVILRQAKNVKTAATTSGLTPIQRASLAAPLLLTPIILGVLQYGLGDLRDKLLNSETKEKMSPERQAARALSRTGYYGQLDPWVNLFASLKYSRDPATVFAGPIFSGVFDTFASMANLSMNNSSKTNTQERQAAKQFWRVMAKPMIVSFFTAMPGPLKVPLIQMVSHPQTEEEFIKSVAGKKKK